MMSTIVKRLVYKQETDEGDKERLELAHDADLGNAYILRWWSRKAGVACKEGSEEIPLKTFLSQGGTAQNCFHDLIGELLRANTDTEGRAR